MPFALQKYEKALPSLPSMHPLFLLSLFLKGKAENKSAQTVISNILQGELEEIWFNPMQIKYYTVSYKICTNCKTPTLLLHARYCVKHLLILAHIDRNKGSASNQLQK